MNVLIAGCGWLGSRIGEVLSRAGARVVGVRRSPDAGELAACGIRPLALDLSSPGDLARLPSGLDAIVACQAPGRTGSADYRRTYLEPLRGLIDLAGERRIGRLVFTGSTRVFGQSAGQEVDETTPVEPSDEPARILTRVESLLLSGTRAAGPACSVVRLSRLYGPGRWGVIEQVRTGALRLGPGDTRWMNFCHRDDAAAIVIAALDRGGAGAVYHGSDAEPISRAELVRFVAERLGIEPQRSAAQSEAPGRRAANRRISSVRTRRELQVELAYPSVREGLESALPRSA